MPPDCFQEESKQREDKSRWPLLYNMSMY
jgi:hypothetical protein